MIFTHSFRLAATVFVCVAGMFFTVAGRADAGFSESISKADYEAAGLKKLSAAQRAKLDALIKAYAAGDYAAAEVNGPAPVAPANAPAPQVAKIEEAPAEVAVAEVVATPAAATPKPKKQKVKIDPGTEIEYNTMDSELVGTFAGFEKGTVFTLANGQRWKVIDGVYVCGPDARVNKVRVKPGVFGSFFLEFEKVSVRAKVQLVK